MGMARGGDLRLEGALVTERGRIDPAVVLVKGGHVHWCGPAGAAPAGAADETVSRPGGILAPGFIDLHVHGAGGADAADGTREALSTLCRAHARHGTTALCPTVLTAPPEVMMRALETIRHATKGAPEPGEARILGSHLEGPFLSRRRAGAQPAEHLRRPDRQLLEELLAAAGGSLRIVTLAPELPGALELISLLVARGVVVSLGHSDATFTEARAAIDAGARLATHTFNGMRPLHHREPGILGAVLSDRRVTAEAIADGVHLDGAVLELLWRLKGPDHLCLVTDCTAALDAAPDHARLGDRPVVVQDGAVRLSDGTLAGSSLTMDRAASRLAQLAEIPVERALAAASRVPAAVLGLEGAGSLVEGAPADLVLLDDQLHLERVLIGGRAVEIDDRR